MLSSFSRQEFSGTATQVSWSGLSLISGQDHDAFFQNAVSDRLTDRAAREDFSRHLRGLATTGMAQDSLKEILEAEEPENRDWAVGEALAEVVLTELYDVVFPWNNERDKRNPRSSLPGADIVGFQVTNGECWLALGEVKCSQDKDSPPGVVYGKSGMINQLERLAENLGLINTILYWIWSRTEGTGFESHFEDAVSRYLGSGNKAAALFGVLIRDTSVAETDLNGRALALSKTIIAPAVCNLLAIYLSTQISSLPSMVRGTGP